jgi:molecular chaperone GrpE
VPDEKKGPASPDLDQAMAEAVRAVEERERSGNGTGTPGRHEENGDQPSDTAPSEKAEERKSASAAVTESLLKAKHELESALKQTQDEAKSLHDKWLRAAADLDNYKKRTAREREEVVKFGNERLLRDFLPVIDDLDRLINSMPAGDPKTQPLIDGVRLIHKKFLDQLEKHGVTSFTAEGQPFDPNTHEAVQQMPSHLPVGTVVNQLQRGFTLSGRLLRPALVTVSLGPATPAGGGSAGQKEQG